MMRVFQSLPLALGPILAATLPLVFSACAPSTGPSVPASGAPHDGTSQGVAHLSSHGAPILAVRGRLLSFIDEPSDDHPERAYKYIDDGALVFEGGKIKAVGPASEVLRDVRPESVKTYPKALIIPGFLDTHIHYPQSEMVGAYGEELLQWLEKYTFPTERQFADKSYAQKVASFFLDELLRNGTTTALVFSTVHKVSVDALFEEAEKRNMRIISGKVLMDRNAPEYLRDTPELAYRESKELIARWHKRGRALYAITPRFAPTSSPEQLRAAKRLVDECPDCYVHTHVSENKSEVEWVKALFKDDVPAGTSYLGVYNHFGLMRPRSVFAHGVFLSNEDFDLLKAKDSAVSFCPTSNQFLGSGLFRFFEARSRGVRLGLGTDIGAGTSFSQLQSLNEAYKIVKLQGGKLSGWQGFYLATLGSARALHLEDRLGSLEVGKEADFAILDGTTTSLGRFRLARTKDLSEELFVHMTVGDDRSVRATYVAGKLAFDRDAK